MKVFLIAVLLGLAGALLARRRGHDWSGPALVVLTLVALVGGGGLLVQRLRAPTPAAEAMNAQAQAARALGEQLVAQMAEGTILVLNYAPTPGERLFTDARWEGLSLALTNPAYRLVAAGPQVVPNTPPAPDFVVFSHERLAVEANAWLAAHPETKAVVSLMPYPPAGLRNGARPVFAFAVPEVDGWAGGLRSGSWKAALLSRRTILAQDGKAPLDWKSQFELVTPETLAEYLKANAAPTP